MLLITLRRYTSFLLPYSNPYALLTHANEESKIWHEIFGHINYKYLSDLSDKDMVIGLPKIKFSKGICQGCILGKHPEHKYEKASHERTYTPLELIHSGIAGPFPHMSMSQAKYTLTFIDYFSRYCWVHFLKHKSEIFYVFKVFRALVEDQYGRKLNILRFENGGEYAKSKFIQYCKYAGIQMQHSIPYTPQQNGVAERKNRSLKEMETCMMEAKTLPPKFWDKAIKFAILHPE